MTTSIKLPRAPVQTTRSPEVIIIGAGIAGLAAALRLAGRGIAVKIIEKEAYVGGKLHQAQTPLGPVDVGPTVFTMRWVFERLFSEANETLDHWLVSKQLDCLAHHRWADGSRLNLYADPQRSRDEIGSFAGLEEAQNFDHFLRDTRNLHDVLLKSFMQVDQPGLAGLIRGLGFPGLLTLSQTSPFRSLQQQLERYFRDPRLLQLFGRYATYCGASPYAAPASLALIAHVEQAGVWSIEGGMGQLARALRLAAERKGAQFVLGERVTRIHTAGAAVQSIELASGESLPCTQLILNADTNALRQGLFGAEIAAECGLSPRRERSLSAITWSGTMTANDRNLQHHNVFFSENYAAEFRQLFTLQQIPAEPTVYLCAPDRPQSVVDPKTRERMFVLINAPATGDQRAAGGLKAELASARSATQKQLARCGIHLNLDAEGFATATPVDFHQRFPATGGALYGAATHGWRAAFQRPGNRTRIAGLYLAGGSVHPGPGVPMAALSGMSAASRVLADLGKRVGPSLPRAAHA